MKDDISTPITEGTSLNAFERDKPGTNARSDAEAAIEELRVRGGVFVNAVRATRMPMVLTDPNLPGNPIVFANESFLKLSGYGMQEVLGQEPHFMNGPATDPKDAKRFEEAIRGDQDDIIETVQYRKDGGRFVATVLISAFKDDYGHTLNHFMSWLDVTRRVEAEEEVVDLKATYARLRESEARLALELADSRALGVAGQAMIDISREAQAEEAILTAAKSIMGADAASLQELDPQTGELILLAHTGFHPDSAAFWACVTRENGGTCGQSLHGRKRTIVEDVAEDPVLSKSDDLAWYQLSDIVAVQTTPLVTRSGQIVGMISTHWNYRHRPDERELEHFDLLARQAADLLERRAAEAALSESEDRLREVLNSMAEGFALFDPNFKIIEVNDATLRLDGRTRGDLIGRSHWEAFPGSEDSPVGELFKRVMRERTPGSLKHAYQWPNGKEMWIDVRAYPNPQGRVACFWRDVTDEKTAADALRESQERQTFLLNLTDALRQLTEPRQIQREASRLLVERLSANRAMYLEIVGRQDVADARITGQFARDVPPFPERVPYALFARGFPAGLLEACETLVVADTANDQRLSEDVRQAWLDANVAAAIATSLIKDGAMIANFGLHNAQPREWKSSEIQLVEEVAERTWAAVERARAEAALRESEERQSFLLKLSDALRLISDAAEMERTAVRLLGEQLGVNQVFYATIIGAGDEWSVEHDYTNGVPSARGRFPMSEFQRGRLPDWQAGKISNVVDSETDASLTAADRAAYASFGARSAVGVPVVKGGRFAALLAVNQVTPRNWTDSELALVQEAAERTWTAIDRARAEAELREKERHTQLLLAELQHRVRNTLAVVRSIARRTAENSSSAADMLSHFQGRLDAFSRVQAALTRSVLATVDLCSLVEDELVAHAARDGEQVSIDGGPVQLEPKTAERMSLAIHELVTNAVKHGALSSEGGKIEISWTKQRNDDGETLHLSWKECGVEMNGQSVEREGFGMELLRRSLPYDLGAETEVELEPTGLRFDLRVPLTRSEAVDPL